MSLPVVNWAYRFLMCQVVASQMRDGTFFFNRASSFVSSLRLMKSAFQFATWAGLSDTGDTLTSPFTESYGESIIVSTPPPPPVNAQGMTHSQTSSIPGRVLGRTVYEQACTRVGLLAGLLWKTQTPGQCLQHIHYQSRRPVYFYCLKTASIHYPKIFFVLFFFFPLCL